MYYVLFNVLAQLLTGYYVSNFSSQYRAVAIVVRILFTDACKTSSKNLSCVCSSFFVARPEPVRTENIYQLKVAPVDVRLCDLVVTTSSGHTYHDVHNNI